MAKAGIYWLASYPKSGNTWFRIFLYNLLKNSDEPVDINHINTGMIASSREWMEMAWGFDTAHLSHDELDELRPSAYEWFAEELESPGHHKIHDAYTYLSGNKPMIPTKGCLGALYFIRNPLDVAISFANHSSCSIDQSIESMGNKKYAFCKSKRREVNQLRQWLLSWSMHVSSWLQAKDIRLCIIRYEDMKLKSQETFTNAANFLGLEVTQEQIKNAIANSKIDKLKDLEAENGFSEKPAMVKSFFRKGKVGDWQDTLTEAQINRIIDDHGDIMREFGYLDDNNIPLRVEG